jgi:hypothetical protein
MGWNFHGEVGDDVQLVSETMNLHDVMCCCTVFRYVLPFSPFYLCAYGSRNKQRVFVVFTGF